FSGTVPATPVPPLAARHQHRPPGLGGRHVLRGLPPGPPSAGLAGGSLVAAAGGPRAVLPPSPAEPAAAPAAGGCGCVRSDPAGSLRTAAAANLARRRAVDRADRPGAQVPGVEPPRME